MSRHDLRFAQPHKYKEITCSQCGLSFGSGNFGYSHCDDHRSDVTSEPQKIVQLSWTPRNAEDQWFSGRYKIQWYGRALHHEARYHAYVIRPGDTCWGYYIDPKTPDYRTLMEAKAACLLHARRNP